MHRTSNKSGRGRTYPHKAPRNRSSSSALDGDVPEACAAVENGLLAAAAATIPLAFLEKKENNTIQNNSINCLKGVDGVGEILDDAL